MKLHIGGHIASGKFVKTKRSISERVTHNSRFLEALFICSIINMAYYVAFLLSYFRLENKNKLPYEIERVLERMNFDFSAKL